ncbi:hypothetical protein N7456_013489 [Penicillium angulare]|uniref:Uncharacterized protein n=1 Tax=Penicillium angulare TaxID=116970 RepID=A0A9W9EGD8_9EURO|nr:hypothetical protein N7456_013489 [Penicillium angulare]
MPTISKIQDIWRKTSRSPKELNTEKNDTAPLIPASITRQSTLNTERQEFTAKRPFEQAPYSAQPEWLLKSILRRLAFGRTCFLVF